MYRQHGMESALFAYAGGGVLEPELRARDIEVFVGTEGKGVHDDDVRKALAWKPDVVHLHRPGMANVATGAIARAAKSNPRRGTSAPTGVMETNVFGRVDYSTDRACIDVHLQLSDWCLWKWRQWSRMQSPQPFGLVLPNLVMHEEFQPTPPEVHRRFRADHGIPQDALLFGRIGSPNLAKWSTVIFDAFANYARLNAKAWLLLAGMPRQLNAAVEALPNDVRCRVVTIDFLHGAVQLNEAYGAMDVFLHAADVGESFGMVLAEALLCGTPVITLSTPVKDNSQLEVVGHEVGGLVVANSRAMIGAMQRLENAELRARYAKQGAQSVRERFGPERLGPRAIAIAELAMRGFLRDEFRRQVLARLDVKESVSSTEIRTLMNRVMGEYRFSDLTLLHLVSNPVLYRAYVAMTRRAA